MQKKLVHIYIYIIKIFQVELMVNMCGRYIIEMRVVPVLVVYKI